MAINPPGIPVVYSILTLALVSLPVNAGLPTVGRILDEAAAQEDPLAGESPAETRIIRDAQQLSQAAGDHGAGLNELLATLFNASGDATDDERLAAAAAIRERIASIEAGGEESHPVARQLGRRVRLAEAAVQGLKESNADEATRKLTDDLIVRAAIDFESGARATHAKIVRAGYRTLHATAPAVHAKIKPSIARDYFNYNLHFVLSEPMMSRLVSDYRTESGDIADCILGAWVTGCQVTDTSVRANIKPSTTNAAFDLEVHGRTRTNTRGRKSPATIFSRGNHRFVIRKPTYFDGETLSADEASMDVNINTRTTGVSTDYDGIPIFGGIARGIARNRAAQQQPKADAIAARKLANKALPQFEDEVAQTYADANSQISDKLLARLKERGLYPTAYSARSSNTHLALSSRTIYGETLAAPRPPKTPAPSRGLAIQIHQTSINASIDSMGISGKMTPTQVITKIESSLSELLDREVTIDKSEIDDSTTLDFSAYDPIRVRFEDGAVVIILRTGFLQENKTVGKHLIEVPLKISLDGDNIVLTSPEISGSTKGWRSRPLEEDGSKITARVVINQLMKKTFQDPEMRIDATHNLDLGNGTNLDLKVTRLEPSDGWLTVVME